MIIKRYIHDHQYFPCFAQRLRGYKFAEEKTNMSEKIKKNLSHAFAIESRAAVRNKAFALKAQRDGYSHLAHLFRAMANAKSVHSRRFLYLMRGKIGTTEENLEAAFQNEIKAREEEYPEMVQVAKKANKAVKKAFIQAMKTDGEFEELYKNAMKDMLAENNAEYYVCQICGHISEGFVPENCPICRAVSGRFKRVP
jgi:rubrerythrin